MIQHSQCRLAAAATATAARTPTHLDDPSNSKSISTSSQSSRHSFKDKAKRSLERHTRAFHSAPATRSYRVRDCSNSASRSSSLHPLKSRNRERTRRVTLAQPSNVAVCRKGIKVSLSFLDWTEERIVATDSKVCLPWSIANNTTFGFGFFWWQSEISDKYRTDQWSEDLAGARLIDDYDVFVGVDDILLLD